MVGSNSQCLMAAVNKDGFILDACDLVEGGNERIATTIELKTLLIMHWFLRSCSTGVGDDELLEWAEN